MREYLRDALEIDLDQRIDAPATLPLYGGDGGLQFTGAETDLDTIDHLLSDAYAALSDRETRTVAQTVQHLMDRHGVPEDLRRRLGIGVLEANVHILQQLRRRTTGAVPLVFDPDAPLPPLDPAGSLSSPPVVSAAPLASTLVALFGQWGIASGGWRAGAEAQAKTSIELFLEVCGDRHVDLYTRADGDNLRNTLRRLPRAYRKSPKDLDKPLTQIITEADAQNAPRISDKTVKRHFWAVSRFFAFLVETGRLPKGAENPGRGFAFNTKGPARKQRDMWAGDEIRQLFASPIWTGSHSYFRMRRGDRIIRDARFWLPLLGLYHGNRLEEFAQLRREDVRLAEGIPYLRISDDDGRQLKNDQSRRHVPLHSELIRMGFLDYVAKVTARPQDQVFPELRPGGRDHKLGYSFSKQFSEYRKDIGLRRRGLDYHSFRHGVTTKLYQADVSEAWIDLLTGHDQGGGESRRRYLKGIPLPQLRSAIERVTWPELDLSALYVREAGDERWPLHQPTLATDAVAVATPTADVPPPTAGWPYGAPEGHL